MTEQNGQQFMFPESSDTVTKEQTCILAPQPFSRKTWESKPLESAYEILRDEVNADNT